MNNSTYRTLTIRVNQTSDLHRQIRKTAGCGLKFSHELISHSIEVQ